MFNVIDQYNSFVENIFIKKNVDQIEFLKMKNDADVGNGGIDGDGGVDGDGGMGGRRLTSPRNDIGTMPPDFRWWHGG